MTADELDILNRLISIFLETAELRVKEEKDLTINFWRENVNALLTFHGKTVLQGSGPVTNAEMENKVHEIYREFDLRRKIEEARQADEEELHFLKEALALYYKRKNENR